MHIETSIPTPSQPDFYRISRESLDVLNEMPLPPKIEELPAEERVLMQPEEMLARFVKNWMDKGRDPALLKKVISEVRVLDREMFKQALVSIADQIIESAGQIPTVAVSSFHGSSGKKISESDMFNGVRLEAQKGNLVGLYTSEKELKAAADNIPDGATVFIFDDASYSGGQLHIVVEDLHKLQKNLKIIVCTTVITEKALDLLMETGVSEVRASYKMPTPGDLFSEEDHAKLRSYYGSIVDAHWRDGVYGAISHRIPDNFFLPFNFSAETVRVGDQPFMLTLLDQFGKIRQKVPGLYGLRRGEVGLYNEVKDEYPSRE